jgi:hypothetical protein
VIRVKSLGASLLVSTNVFARGRLTNNVDPGVEKTSASVFMKSSYENRTAKE